MKREQVLDKVKDILADTLSVSKEEVKEEVTLADLGADSLDAVNSMMEVEKKFNIAFCDSEAEKIKTVKDLVDLVISHTQTV